MSEGEGVRESMIEFWFSIANKGLDKWLWGCYPESVQISRFPLPRCEAFFYGFDRVVLTSMSIVSMRKRAVSRNKLHRGGMVSTKQPCHHGIMIPWYHEFKRVKTFAKMLFSPCCQ